MLYYSEVTHKNYKTSDECIKAEEEALNRQLKEKEEKEKKAAERKARAAEVEAARKVMVEAQNSYRKILESFIRDYKTYHYSSSNVEDIPTLFDFFNFF